MPLPSLPFDVLLAVFRNLDIVDVVRIGMTCNDLCRATQDRHVWVDQLEKLRPKDPALRSATPALTSLSAQKLRTFVTGLIKLRLRWNKGGNETDFAAKGLVGVPGVCELRLLPGGESVIFINGRGGVTLRRIKLEDGQVSLPVVADIKYDQRVVVGPGWSRLLTSTSPCPILVHKQGCSMHILRIDHHNDAMSLETTFPLPEGHGFLQAHGKGRVVGFLIHGPRGHPRVVVIHLDHPGVVVESVVSLPHTAEAGSTSCVWSFCIPTESLAIIYNTQHILAYRIPNFSRLSVGVNLSNATPMWYWPGLDLVGENISVFVSYTTSEALHDPPSAQEVNLHYVCKDRLVQAEPFVITVTIPINTTNDEFASNPTEPPTLKQKTTPVENHGRRSAGFSCQKGLHSDKALLVDKLDILVTPLDDLVLESGRGVLRMFVSYKELGFKFRPLTIEMDMDEATGRVIIWGWDKDAYETKVFVGDLV